MNAQELQWVCLADLESWCKVKSVCLCVVFSCCVSRRASFINSCMLCWLNEVCCFIIKVSKRILKPINRPFRIKAPRFYLPEALRWSNSPSCHFQVWQEEGRQEQRCSKSFKEQTGGTEWGGAGQDPWWQRWVWITKNPQQQPKNWHSVCCCFYYFTVEGVIAERLTTCTVE